MSTNTSIVSQYPGNPVDDFLCHLKRPCGHLLQTFTQYGITSSADLDALCKMEEYWKEVEQYLLGKGVTPFEWLVVQEGLRARATMLSVRQDSY